MLLRQWQQRKFALDRELKAAEAALVRKGARTTVRETFVAVLDDVNDVLSGFLVAVKRRSSQVAAGFEAGY